MYFPIRTLYLTWKIEQRERRKFFLFISCFFFVFLRNLLKYTFVFLFFILQHVFDSGILRTYPSPNLLLTLTSHLGQNVGLGRGRWTVSVKLILNLSGNEPAFFRFGSCCPFPALRLVARFPRLLFCFPALAYELLMKFQIPDKMEAAAAGISAHRSSTGGTNTTSSSDSQNATSAAPKTSTTGSETGQTSTAAASTTTTGTAAVSSQASGMWSRL